MKGQIEGKWNIHCRSRCRRGRIGLVSLPVLRPVVFVPHGAKGHNERFRPAPLLPASQSLTTTPSHCTRTHRMVLTGRTTPTPFSISNYHTITMHPYPQKFVPLAAGAPPPPLKFAHTKTMMKAPPHTHPLPHQSLLPPSSMLPFP